MADDTCNQQDLCEETIQQLNRTKSNEVTPQQREAFVKLLANFVRYDSKSGCFWWENSMYVKRLKLWRKSYHQTIS